QIIRQGETVASASYLHVAPRDLVTLLVPDYHGSSLAGNFRGPLALSIETTIYAGILTLPLALAGALHRNRRLAACLAGMAALGLDAVAVRRNRAAQWTAIAASAGLVAALVILTLTRVGTR